MTDTDIIKALECCTNYPACPTDCPLFEQPVDCLLKLSKPTLNLINRQKAEIEQLEKDKESFANSYAKAVARNLTIKAEAVEEFAEKFKKIAVCGKTYVFRFPYYQISMEAFDNLAKEMVGETDV